MQTNRTCGATGLKRFGDWPTLVLLALTYVGWVWATLFLADVSVPLAIAVCAITAALHSSLTHEMLHGHPFRNPILNALLVFPALVLVVPYMRFRDTHLAHHQDEKLTDPYDDPETNFLDPAKWDTLRNWQKRLYRFNNTLAGRLTVGPMIGQMAFMLSDWRLIRSGHRRVLLGWLLHIPAVAVVVYWMVAFASMPLWAWLVSVYIALSLLKLRTFLEHRAHKDEKARTAIVEDRGLFALLFLNNNLHVVHHQHPKAPWYALPRLYEAQQDAYLASNQGYRYNTYSEIIRKYFFTPKDPVPHPLYRGGQNH